jgi:hypothetical protein
MVTRCSRGTAPEGMNTVNMARGPRSSAIRFGNQMGRTEEMVTNCLDKRSSSRALKKGDWTG